MNVSARPSANYLAEEGFGPKRAFIKRYYYCARRKPWMNIRNTIRNIYGIILDYLLYFLFS